MLRRPLALSVLGIATLTACSSTIDRATLHATTSTSIVPATTTTLASTPTTTTLAPTTTTTTQAPTTTTEAPIVTRGGVLKIANAANVDLAASLLTEEFAALGFDIRDATNAAGVDRELEISRIYVVAGSEAVAFSVSRLMGGIDVYAMTTPAWIKGGTEGLGDATVLIMLGKDLAKVELADMTE